MQSMEENNMVNKIERYRKLAKDSKFICMFSGGKDSGLALAEVLGQGQPLALIHILDENESLYHKQSLEVIQAQSKAMNIPLILMPYKWWRDWERASTDLAPFLESGANSIVFGDIRLKYIFLGDIPLCEKNGFTPCLPVGGVAYDDLVSMIEKHGLVSIITKINHPCISKDLLGKPFTRDVYNYLKELNVDPFGELDEFHTTLVDADFFVEPLRYHLVPRGENMVSVIIDTCPD